jgi:hypothetical protein
MNISKCYKLKSCETRGSLLQEKEKEIKNSPIYGMFHMLIYIFAYLKAVSSVIYTNKESSFSMHMYDISYFTVLFVFYKTIHILGNS